MADADVRNLTTDDLDWVLELTARRRARLAEFAPRMWRPAPDAATKHRPFLTKQIDDPRAATLRTDHGFVFGPASGGFVVVDDLAVDDEAHYAADGPRLLRAAAAGRPLRLVGTVPEAGRSQLAISLGLAEYDAWWHHDLEASGSVAEPSDPALEVDGASGRLVPSPPVYAPGGPVLFVAEVADPAAVAMLEARAAAAGSPVAIAPVPIEDTERADILSAAGYLRTSIFYQGRPAGAG